MSRSLVLIACLALALTVFAWLAWLDAGGEAAHPTTAARAAGPAPSHDVQPPQSQPIDAQGADDLLSVAVHEADAAGRTELDSAHGWVRGTVSFEGAPPSAPVALFATNVVGASTRVETLTAAGGRFEFELEPGDWRVTCVGVAPWPQWREDVQVVEHAERELLFDYGASEERVVSVWENSDDVLRPLEGASVRIVHGSHSYVDAAFDLDSLELEVARTDVAGRARLNATARGSGVIVVDAPGFVRALVRDGPQSPERQALAKRTASERAHETHVFLERAGRPLRGVVRGADGRALSNAIVQLEGGAVRDRRVLGDCDRLALAATGDRALPLATVWLGPCARTDSNGRFVLPTPAGGPARRQLVQLVAYPGREGLAHHALVNLTPDELARDAEVVLVVPGARMVELRLATSEDAVPDGLLSVFSMDGRPYSPERRLRVDVAGVGDFSLSAVGAARTGSLQELVAAARRHTPSWPVVAGRARVSLPVGAVLLRFRDAESDWYDPLGVHNATPRIPGSLDGPLRVELTRVDNSLAGFEAVDGGYRWNSSRR